MWRAVLLFVDLEDSVDDWDVPAFDFEDNNFTNSDGLFRGVCKEEQVPSVEGGLHGTTAKENSG